MEIKKSISISSSPQKIWNFWMPVTTDTQRRDGIKKAEWVSEPPYGIGSKGIHYHEKYGAMPWTIIKFTDGQHIEWIHDRESILKGSTAYYHVDPEDGGSRVTLYVKIIGPLIMRILIVFIKGGMIKGLEGEMNKLKELMEK